jgi:hypothetical protein
MMKRALLVCVLLLCCGTLYARSKTDVLVMTNGDHLTCEIKGLGEGVLYASFDYILSTQSVEWSKVDHVESKQLFIVRTEDGTVYTGTIATVSAPGTRPVEIQIASEPEKQVTVKSEQIVRLSQTSNQFWQRFNGSVNFGLIYSKGNQSTQYNLSSDVDYPRPRWTAGASLTSSLSSSTGASASVRNEVVLTGQHLMRPKNWFYAGVGDFLQSSEQGINLETTLGGGVGRYLKNTNNAAISVAGGLAWQSTDYQQAGSVSVNQDVATALVNTSVRLFQFNKTTLSVTASVFPALSTPGRVHFNTNVSYYVKIFGDLTWNASFYGNWDNQPPPGFAGSDYGTSSGLGWTFGTK